MSEKLTYEELKFPNYVNSNTAVKLRANVDGELRTIDLSVSDLAYAIEVAGLNALWVSDTGLGKTQLISDIDWHHFGGHGKDGNANWADGRPEFDIEELFIRQQVDLSSGKYDSDTARQIDETRTRRVFHAVDEINAAPGPTQFRFFDLADGKYAFKGQRYELGKDGYSVCMATANLNRRGNGDDFHGTFELNRALLNRAHVTIDFDHRDFRPTPEDEMVIEQRKSNPRVDVAEPQDLSEKIIHINKEIRDATRKQDPYLTAFRFLIGRGLDYCERDKYKDKGSFPMLCSDCDVATRDDNPNLDFDNSLCSLIKASSTRTLTGIKALAYGLSYIAGLKTGKKVEIDPLDAALQAFKFTTYHGNLNDIVAEEEYGERRQAMMDTAVERLSERVEILRPYIPMMVDGYQPVSLIYDLGGKKFRTAKAEDLIRKLGEKKIPYQETDLKTELRNKGVGTDWIDTYVKVFGRK